MSTMLEEIRQLQTLPETLNDCHAEISRLRAVASGLQIKLTDTLDAEARANARATDTADRFAGFVADRRAEWMGLFSQAGAAKLCKSAGLKVGKYRGQLPTKGSLLTKFDRMDSDAQMGAITDLFDQLLPEDFEQ